MNMYIDIMLREYFLPQMGMKQRERFSQTFSYVDDRMKVF